LCFKKRKRGARGLEPPFYTFRSENLGKSAKLLEFQRIGKKFKVVLIKEISKYEK
jgi:hypothetical protein